MCYYHQILSLGKDFFVGIAGGIVASIMYDYYRAKRIKKELEDKYKYLLSKNMFDWKCYTVNDINTLSEDGANVMISNLNGNTLNYHHKHPGIEYMGLITMDDSTFGRQTFNYPDRNFSGVRTIILGEKKYKDKMYDFIYIPKDPIREIMDNQIWMREK